MKLDSAMLASQVWVADGGWATVLRARGWPLNRAAELASVERPELVSQLARDYLAAGARLITTNTFSANAMMLQRRRISVDAAELNRRSATLVRQAVDEAGVGAFVVGSIGPSGRILAVREASEEELRRNVAEQARVLAECGADALVLETFSELQEIVLALDEAKRASGLPVIASMSFDSGPQRTNTLMGAEAATCATVLSEHGADAIGSNCGGGMADALPAVVALRANTTLPLWVKPSVGPPELEDGRPVYRQTPEEFAAHVATLVSAGANVLGGCCGAGPEHIRHLVAAIAGPRRPRR